MDYKQDFGNGVTTFDIEKDEKGWKAVMRRDNKVIKERYALDEDEAKLVRTLFVNQFWGNQLN